MKSNAEKAEGECSRRGGNASDGNGGGEHCEGGAESRMSRDSLEALNTMSRFGLRKWRGIFERRHSRVI